MAATLVSDSKLSKVLGWIFTPIYFVLFVIILLAFHPIQVFANLFGYRAHKLAIDLMNYFVILNFSTIGAKFEVKFDADLPEHRSLIFVANHQSMYDIPFLIWYLRDRHPKFIAKIELGKGIPSISYALRHMGSVLIDRSDPESAVPRIEDFAQNAVDKGFSACIFPEGTRARDGKLKRFKTSGLRALLNKMPDSPIVPIAVTGSWELLRYRFKPVPFGVKVKIRILEALDRNELTNEELIVKVEETIRAQIPEV